VDRIDNFLMSGNQDHVRGAISMSCITIFMGAMSMVCSCLMYTHRKHLETMEIKEVFSLVASMCNCMSYDLFLD
jgi:hypothetical protein